MVVGGMEKWKIGKIREMGDMNESNNGKTL